MSSQPLIHRYASATDEPTLGRAARGVLGYPLVIWRHRGLVANFFRRDLLGRFRGSWLGIFWVLIQPLFLFAIYYLVFGFLFGPRTSTGGPSPEFPFLLFSGIVAFSAFLEGTARSCTVVVDNGNLVKKVAFPSELLVVHPAIVSLIVYVVGMLVLLAAGIPLGVVKPDGYMLAWPLVLIVHVTMTLGVGLLLANLFVFARDVSHLYAIVGQAWLFISPVFWTYATLEDAVPRLAPLFLWNPLYPLILAHRQAIGLGAMVDSPFWGNLGLAAVWAAVFATVGYATFMSRRHKFADLV